MADQKSGRRTPPSYLVSYEDHATSALHESSRTGQRAALAAARSWAITAVDEGLFTDLRNYGIDIPLALDAASVRGAIGVATQPLFREDADEDGYRRIDRATELDAGQVTGAAQMALDWLDEADHRLSRGGDVATALDEVASALMHLAFHLGLPYRAAPTVGDIITAQ